MVPAPKLSIYRISHGLSAMDDEQDRPSEWALSVLSAATVHGMREDAEEMAELVRIIRAPLPVLSEDIVLSERRLALALLLDLRAAAQRLVQMIENEPSA